MLIFENEESFICQYCGRVCKNTNSLRNHERLCKENPDHQEMTWLAYGGFSEYNKKVKAGLIKGQNHYTKAKRLGLPKPQISEETHNKLSKIHKGILIPQEIKEKISKTQKKNYEGGKCMWSTAVEHRLSYAEQHFADIFTDAKMHYHVNRYFLDFAWPDKKIYLEIDGQQHKRDLKVIQHDIERTENLQNDGWILIDRVYWPDFSKLTYNERIEYINNLKNKIYN